jgi:hypothetical protein
MALTIDGIPVSGSIGINTHSRNRYGAYTRRRTKPVNPSSSRQNLVRMGLRTAVDVWTNTLTSAERNAWSTYAAATPTLNRAGQTVNLTGQAEFVRFYTFFWYNTGGAPPTLAAPAIFDRGSLAATIGNVTHDISANSLAYTLSAPQVANSWNVEDGWVFVRLTQPANASVNFRPNRSYFSSYEAVGATPTDTYALTDSSPDFTYGAGQRVWAWIRAMTPDNRVTQPQLYGPVSVVDVP